MVRRVRTVTALSVLLGATLGLIFWFSTEKKPGSHRTADCQVCGCNQACAF